MTAMTQGKDFKTYLFEYRHEGSCWGFEIRASSQADAEERVAKLQFATCRGEVHEKIPAVPGSGLLARSVCWIKNFGATRRSPEAP